MSESAERRAYRLRPERWLYIITDGEHCKIGYAACPYTRLKQLQGGNHRELTIVAKWMFPSEAAARDAEVKAQGQYWPKRIRGEWFAVLPEVAHDQLAQMFEGWPTALEIAPGASPTRYLTKRQRARLAQPPAKAI